MTEVYEEVRGNIAQCDYARYAGEWYWIMQIDMEEQVELADKAGECLWVPLDDITHVSN